MVKIDQSSVPKNGNIGKWQHLVVFGKGEDSHDYPHAWQESYRAAVLETDWTRILVRIQEAESAMVERRRVLSLDHGGTPEERHALAAALGGLKVLRGEVSEWNSHEHPRTLRD